MTTGSGTPQQTPVQRAAKVLAEGLTEQAANDVIALDSSKLRAIHKKIASMADPEGRIKKFIKSDWFKLPATALLAIAVTGGFNRDNNSNSPTTSPEQQRIEQLSKALTKAKKEIADLKDRPPEVVGFDAAQTIFLKYNQNNGYQVVYIPNEFWKNGYSIALPGQQPISFEEALKTIGDAGKPKAMAKDTIVAHHESWRSNGAIQVDERILQTMQDQFNRNLNQLRKDAKGYPKGVNYYFTLNANDEMQIHRDPLPAGGSDIKPVPVMK